VIGQALKPYLKPDAYWNVEAYLKLAADEKNYRMGPPSLRYRDVTV
jgi:hypothetical protein